MTAEELGAAWQEAMFAGDFEAAWCASDAIRALETEDPHRFWLGEDLGGKRVMLRCLHGFGDSVQFLRYLPLLQRLATSLCVEVGPRFAELARCFDGIGEVIVWGEQEPAWDIQIEVTELAYLFRTRLAQLPIAEGYLRVQAAERPTDGLRQVGLVWTAGEWNRSREVSLEALRPLLKTPGCAFWNLTQEPADGLLGDHIARESLIGLARRIAALDLLITVDTLAAHLAGAMGVPVWVMLHEESDWRWMRGREDSPWYPSMRLFRDGDVLEALRVWAR